MVRIMISDAVEKLREIGTETVDCCITSPPYYKLRDYGVCGQIGLERTPEEYIERLVEVFGEVKRVLRPDGTLWIVIGDCYAAKNMGKIKQKDIIGIPWMLAFALRADGWYLRSDIVWNKPNVMPESVKDRPTRSHEFIFLLSKSRKYYYDYESIMVEAKYDGRKVTMNKGSSKYERVDGQPTRSFHITGREHERWQFRDGHAVRNIRDVWTVTNKPYKGAHFACYPPDLIEPCILAGSRFGGTVLDPFIGSGTTAQVCQKLGRNCIGIELNESYVPLISERLGEELCVK